MPRMVLLLIAILLQFLVFKASAAEIFEFYTGARSLGMGGAYVTTVNDETAIWTNPAGLGKLRDYYVTLFDPELEAGTNAMAVINSENYNRVGTIQGLQTELNNNRGKYFHAKAQVSPSFAAPNFGLGFMAKYNIDSQIDTAATNFRVDYTYDLVSSLAYCFRFWDGIIKIGASAKLINRVEIARDLDPAGTGYTVENLSSEGMGVSATGGLILTAPIRWLPSIGGVVRDIGNTAYTLNNGMVYQTTTRPRHSPQKVDAGISLSPILGKYARFVITAEVHDVTTISEETDIMRRTHGGIEFNIADFFFIRGGMNQRYWTGGVEFATRFFQLQAATYGEEIGTATTPLEDRRYVGKLSIRF